MLLTDQQLDLVRQWFNAVQDVSPQYLTAEDYALAKTIHESLGVRFSERQMRSQLPEYMSIEAA